MSSLCFDDVLFWYVDLNTSDENNYAALLTAVAGLSYFCKSPSYREKCRTGIWQTK